MKFKMKQQDNQSEISVEKSSSRACFLGPLSVVETE